MKGVIKKVSALEILDSRGVPTVMARVELESGVSGIASVPSGASVGRYEAHELRDGDASRYGGLGVRDAVRSIEEVISPALCGMDAGKQREIDNRMIELDGTESKSNLGANAILAVSLATARSAAEEVGLPLYSYLGGGMLSYMPTPMLNILNGGAHAANNVEIQEFMIVPTGKWCFADKMRVASEIYKRLGGILRSRGYSTSVGDEGGYAPNLSGDEEACMLICSAIEDAGYSTAEVRIALDCAASGWWSDGVYRMTKSGKEYTTGELIDHYTRLTEKYPIMSIEDGLGEEDYEGWRELTDRLSYEMMLVGDDLFVTNRERFLRGAELGLGNSILIKPNQIGTLTECVDVITTATELHYKPIISHRSGETEDSFIADLSVAMKAPYVKMGAPCRSERLAKYNRLIMIGGELGLG